MPSPRSKRPLDSRGVRGSCLLLLLLTACTAPVQRPEIAPVQRPIGDAFLVAPTVGYRAVLPAPEAEALESAYRALIRGGEPAAALAAAEGLRGSEAEAPATVLAAQARYINDQCGMAIGQLASVVEANPGYLAAELVLGRCREAVGDLPGAAAAYASAAAESTAAAARLRDLAPRARDAAVARIRGWIEGGLGDEAAAGIDSLQRWAPQDLGTFEALRELAELSGDQVLELRMARALTTEGGPRELMARRAELELGVGDSGAGLRILEQLAAQYPEDAELARGLERARFAWRMSMLPRQAQELAVEPQLDRGQLASLFYWVFPSVRYGRPSEAIIANDILDHEQRNEIVKVVNLGIMEIDSNLHAFEPEEGARRLDALRGMLRVLAQQSGGAACLGGTTVAKRLPIESTCALATRCGLLSEVGDCLPQAVLSGSSAMRMARTAARQLESR